MVIEDMSRGGLDAIHDRFERDGRMLPEGVEYLSSWIEEDGRRCFQLMEAEDAASLDEWVARWSDIVGLEIVPVLPSTDFWKRRGNP
ncbi:MAG TPA: DUF3303 family protein [Sphingomicrobium sp.]|nr:DUF3303 family protein [Sphingomicrobium sp.]